MEIFEPYRIGSDNNMFIIDPDHKGILRLYMEDDSKVATICDLYVEPEYRRQGLASKLLGEAELIAYEYGYSFVWLKANAENKELIQFYINRGYEKFMKDATSEMWYIKKMP